MNNILNKRKWKNIVWLISITMFFLVDRFLKQLALKQENQQSFSILSNWLKFRLVFNPNIAFSLPINGYFLLFIITLLVISLFFGVIYLIINKKYQKNLIFPLTFILFGSISNLLDRYLYGAVIDYFDCRYFTIFNLADLMISFGVIMILIKNVEPLKNNKNG